MIVYENGNKVSLSQNDFITKGGEGDVYGKGPKIYKVYHTPKKMIPNGKILELKKIDKINVIAPLDTLSNSKQVDIGFTMNWAKKTISICKLFTNDFRKRNNITDKTIMELVDALREIIWDIHLNKCLIVDLNELNILVDEKFQVPYFIDVDSYQTPSYPATAIMPYVRDYQTKDFNENTDWFSFGILACQLFVGIHPYKGKHPQYKKQDLLKRMKDNVSIFDPDTRLPSAVRDFSFIPETYKAWFEKLFEQGVREAPPEFMGKLVATAKIAHIVASKGDFEIVEILNLDFSEDILYYRRYEDKVIIKGVDAIHINKREYITPTNRTEVVYEESQGTPIFVDIKDGKLDVVNTANLSQDTIAFPCDNMMVIANSVFVQHNDTLSELRFKIFNKVLTKVVKAHWDIMPNSSEMFSGLVYQSVLGKPYLLIPIPTKRETICHIVPVVELEGYKIIEAKHDFRIVQLIGFKDNQYDRINIVFSDKYDSYSCRIIKDIDHKSNNFVVLENGVVVSIVEDGQLEVYSNRLDMPKMRLVESPDIRLSMVLMKDGIKALFAENNKLYSIKLKPEK